MYFRRYYSVLSRANQILAIWSKWSAWTWVSIAKCKRQYLGLDTVMNGGFWVGRQFPEIFLFPLFAWLASTEGVATRFQGVRDSESRHDSSLILLILQSRFPLNFCKFLVNWLFPAESDWFWVILSDSGWFWLILTSKFMIFPSDYFVILSDSGWFWARVYEDCTQLRPPRLRRMMRTDVRRMLGRWLKRNFDFRLDCVLCPELRKVERALEELCIFSPFLSLVFAPD